MTVADTFDRRVAIVTDFLDSIGNLDFDRVGRLLAEDAVMTLPFLEALPPTRGRATIVNQLSTSIPQKFDRMNFHYDTFYDVADSDTLIAEYRSECTRKGGSGTYRNRYITVFEFDGDKISLYKEYLNPTSLISEA